MKTLIKIYGYARVSSTKQSIDRQIRNIRAAEPEAIIIQETYTGRQVEGRERFERLIRQAMREAQGGADVTIIFDSVSRMCRSASEGCAIYQQLFDAGVALRFLREPHIDTAVYQQAMDKRIEPAATGDHAADELLSAITDGINRYMIRLAERQIEIAFEQAEKEVEDLRQRTREGVETARLRGKQIGGQRGRKLTVKKAGPALEVIRKHSRDFEGTLTDAECIKLAGISRNTFYKYKKRLKEEIGR